MGVPHWAMLYEFIAPNAYPASASITTLGTSVSLIRLFSSVETMIFFFVPVTP